MIFEGVVGATGSLSTRFVDVQGYVDTLGDQMAKAILHEARKHGVDISVEDVAVYRGATDLPRDTVEYGAVWAPDPVARGVELIGGSHDGDVVPVERREGPGKAFPPAEVAVLAETPQFFDADTLEPTDAPEGMEFPQTIETYYRAGIDPDKRRFIYKIKVTK